MQKLNLISDGGRENINYYIQNLLMQFYDQCAISIDHKIALKTIRQSNSMIERFFRIMKSNYLYFDIPYSHEALCLSLEKIIHEYNAVRPHYALKHLTPNEAYTGMTLPDIEKKMKLAKEKRMKKNRNCSCTVCTC